MTDSPKITITLEEGFLVTVNLMKELQKENDKLKRHIAALLEISERMSVDGFHCHCEYGKDRPGIYGHHGSCEAIRAASKDYRDFKFDYNTDKIRGGW